MAELAFKDTVRHIAKQADQPRFEVTFRRKAAFYWVAEGKTETVAALQTSALTKSPLELVADSPSMEIVSAKLAP